MGGREERNEREKERSEDTVRKRQTGRYKDKRETDKQTDANMRHRGDRQTEKLHICLKTEKGRTGNTETEINEDRRIIDNKRSRYKRQRTRKNKKTQAQSTNRVERYT